MSLPVPSRPNSSEIGSKHLTGSSTRPATSAGRPQPGVPSAVASLLLRAKTAESESSSGQRVDALRTTRQLLTGAYQAGYSSRDLADCLGVSTQSVRNRLDANSWLPLSAVINFIDVDPLFLHRLRAMAKEVRVAPDGAAVYSSRDIVRAVASSPTAPESPVRANPAARTVRPAAPPGGRRVNAPRTPLQSPATADRLSFDRVRRAMDEVPGL